ncbi:MAG: hypothetical protein HYV93_09575, partial [Candidatus Rokubacteria bacterium]|nr:hypothetical protein [Candidatus Rokubacteria bacterium]
ISGGISKNIGVVRRLEDKLGVTSHICFEPQIVGALGAALFARAFLEQQGSPPHGALPVLPPMPMAQVAWRNRRE